MKKFFYCALVALTVAFTGCYDDDDLWSKVDDLTERVESIEQVIATLNTEIEDMQTIVATLNNGAVITNCEETSAGFKLTFSNGKSIELKNGANGLDGKDAPVIGVKADTDGVYYWTITIAGNTDWLYDDNGNKLRVTGADGKDGTNGKDGQDGVDGADGKDGVNGTDGKDGVNGTDGKDGVDGKDGITPIIGVDGEGYWTVDTGNGAERIKDANGNEVQALGINGDSFFSEVTIGEDEVSFVLANGEMFSVYRIDNFGVTFDASDTEIESGKTKEFALTMTNVRTVFVANVTQGWSAVVKNNTLFITAPTELYADNRIGEIYLIAANRRGDCRAFTLECSAYKMAYLTFEDVDFKATPYTLEIPNVLVDSWSALIDSPEYGGPLLYGDYTNVGYFWYDENNTYLAHEFPLNWGSQVYWGGGHAISNYASTDYVVYGGYNNQLTVYGESGRGGHNGSANFCMHYGYRDQSGYSSENLPAIYFGDGNARLIDHMYVMNSTYALNCYMNGNGLTASISENDWVKIVAIGYHEDGSTAETEIFLCNGPDNIVTEWTKWDLSSLGKVLMVEFNLVGSSDNGYGFSQPAYFAYDDVAVKM